MFQKKPHKEAATEHDELASQSLMEDIARFQKSRNDVLRNFCNNLRKGAERAKNATSSNQKRNMNNGGSEAACIAAMITSVNCII